MNKKSKSLMALGMTAVLAAAIPMGANAAEVNNERLLKEGVVFSSSNGLVHKGQLIEDVDFNFIRKGNVPFVSAGPTHSKVIRIAGDNKELLAFLGMDEETFLTEIKSGKSLLEIAESKGISKEQLIEFQTKQFTANIEQAVKDEKLTEEQAAKMKEDFAGHVEQRLDGNMMMFTSPAPAIGPFMEAIPGQEIAHKVIRIAGDNKELLAFLGIDEETFFTEIKGGKSLLEIAESKGITKEQLIEFQTKQFTANIDQAVKDGKLTEEQAAKMKEDFAEHVEQGLDGNMLMFNSSPAKGPFMEAIPGQAFAHKAIRIDGDNKKLLTFLGMDEETFFTEIKSGKSLLEIAESKGISKEQLIEFQTKQFTANIDQAVKDGKLTEEQAAKMKEDFAGQVEQHLDGKAMMFTKPVRIEMKMPNVGVTPDLLLEGRNRSSKLNI